MSSSAGVEYFSRSLPVQTVRWPGIPKVIAWGPTLGVQRVVNQTRTQIILSAFVRSCKCMISMEWSRGNTTDAWSVYIALYGGSTYYAGRQDFD